MAEPSVARNARRFEDLPIGAQRAIERTARQAANLTNLLNREEERIYWDGGPWMAPVYNDSERARRQNIIDRALQNRAQRIRARYNI